MIFNAVVTGVNSLGLFVDLQGAGLRGFLSSQSLPLRKKGEELESGTELPVIVTYVDPNTNMIGLSGRKELLNVASCQERMKFESLKIGDILENVKVTQVTPHQSVYFKISRDLNGIANRKQLQVRII